MRSSILTLAAVCLLVGVVAATRVPESWELLGRVENDARVPVLIAVAHGKDASVKLETQCMAVSDPASASYGHHMSQKQVAALLGAEDSLQTVMEFLLMSGVSESHISVGAMGDFVTIKAPVSVVERVFGVEMNLYRVKSPKTGKTTYLARSATRAQLPTEVEAAIDVMLGLDDFAVSPERAFPPASTLAASKARAQTGAETAREAINDAASRLRGAADVPSPPGSVLTVVSEVFYMYFQASPTPGVSYELELTIDGSRTATVPFTAADCTPVSLLGAEFLSYNFTDHIKLYSAYNYTLTAVNSAGRSPPAAIPMQWDTIPSSWQGVIATPTMTPQDYIEFYGLSSISGASAVSQSVAEFSGQYYSPTDLATFLAKYNINNEPSVTLVGSNQASNPGIEAQMDIELIIGVAPMVPSDFWEVTADNTFPNGWMLEWASQMSDSSSPPLVTSISYGAPEDAYGSAYHTREQNEFLKLCTRGLTVMVASGDAGATSDGHGGGACELAPSYPGSSSWVTSVSATVQSAVAPKRANGGVGEAAISIATGEFWTTGGGFSTIASNRRPAYQAKAVEAYISSATMPAGYNKTGRAYPDVSSIGTNYWMTIGGVTVAIGSGTSSASPTFAGIVTHLNAARLAAGKPSVGFINPLLYSLAASNPEVFYDVTVGSNECGEYICCPGVGFNTATGWDAVTGLGTVGDFDLLLKLVMAAAE